MSFRDWIQDYLDDFYNKIVNWMVKRIHRLHANTVWNMMRCMDKQLSSIEMEHYINEYKRWKENDFKIQF